MGTSSFDSDDLEANTVAEIREQVQREVGRCVDLAGNQLELSHVLDYRAQSSVSKLLAGRQLLTTDKARLLDAWLVESDATTQCGRSLVDLVAAIHAGERLERAKPTDVFLASPMSAQSANYEANRKLVLGLAKALRAQELRTYCALDSITKTSKFDSHELAYKANLEHIMDSRLFVLFLPPPDAPTLGSTAPAGAPSSVWIELGMALARRLPCTLLVPSIDLLPFIVRRAITDGDRPGQHVIDVRQYDSPRQPAQLIKRHGPTWLAGGATL